VLVGGGLERGRVLSRLVSFDNAKYEEGDDFPRGTKGTNG